uniref:Three-finger toxin n=1 Tax=Calliophis bivirgatus TaxID=8633 RepID=A0A898IPK1_CALBG|nr:three-finger toxin [Calliophis bivirgatus]
MKTLLLTLVVVTILCLDLGYTLKCYNTIFPAIYKTCPKGQNLCYLKRQRFDYLVILVSRGCTDKCPKDGVCCNTDKCNV